MSGSNTARESDIASETGASSPGGPVKGEKRVGSIKTKDDVSETGVYFNRPLLRFEAWMVTSDTKKLVGWIGIEACAASPRWKDYWDKYVWEEYLVIDKTTPKDLLEKVLSD